jgi:hypothetical protein
MNTLKGLGSDIKLRSIKQVSASLLADDMCQILFSIGPQNLQDNGKMIVRQMRLLRIYVVQGLRIGKYNNENHQSICFPFAFLTLF